MKRMWTCGLAAVSLFGCVIIATGAPFERTVSFTQPNGAVIELWGKGDEFRAVFETPDGYTVVYAPESKAYYYAALSADGTDLVPTVWQAGAADPAALGLAKHLRKSSARARAEAQSRFERWDTAVQLSERWRQRKATARAAEDGRVPMAPPAYTTTGTKVGLCLLIDFSDAPATVPQAQIMDFCNGDAYTGFGNNGSVKKYYQDVSNGLLTYTNIVTAYIRMTQPKSYYDDTSKDFGDQGNLLIRDAIAILKAQPNYASQIAPALAGLTVDGSGRAAACNVFFAGADSGVWSFGLWPHSWSLWNVGAQALTDDIDIWNYQITNIGDSLELGTFCHENGHMLCDYPDIYDYDIDPQTDDYESVGGAGVFCLMNSGGHGVNPVQVCAYLKRASGWATTLDLTASSDLTASLSASGAGFNTFYRYAKPGVPTEYYLIENRQAAGRDASLPASGIAVWHIDELGDRDNQSLAYNTVHENYECTLMQADGLWDFQFNANHGDDGDLFHSSNPADGYQNVFNDETLPSARWWDGSVSGLNLFAFSASGTVMTFEAQPLALMITTANPLPNGAVSTAYSQTLAAFGGQPPYTWSLTAGALPAGLSLSSDGVISGTPTGAGTALFDVQVVDATNGTASASFSLTVMTALPPPPPPPPSEPATYLCSLSEDEPLETAGAYEGYLFGQGSFAGGNVSAVRGTLSVKVSKLTGTLTVKAALLKGNLSFSAKEWATPEGTDGTFGATLTAKGGEKLELSVRQNRISGSLTGGSLGVETLSLDGARNRFADTRDAEAQALLAAFKGYYTMALPSAAPGISASEQVGAAPEGVGYLALTIGAKGSAKVAGVLADGTKVSRAGRLLLFDGCRPDACVPLFSPLYGKKGWVGGLLWVIPEGGTVTTDDEFGWFLRWENPGKAGPDGFSMLLDVCGGFYGTGAALAAAYLFGADTGDTAYHDAGGVAAWTQIPAGMPVTVEGGRMKAPKGAKPKKVTEEGVTRYVYDAVNPAGVTLSFASKSGIFKGKFSLYGEYDANGAPVLKAVSVPYAGILVPVRDGRFDDLPAGVGHCLIPDTDPAAAPFKLKRSHPVWLE